VLKPRKKISEKQEIKQDFAVELYFKTIDFFKKYTKQILIGTGVVVALIIFIVFYNINKSKNNQHANIELQKVIQIYQTGNYEDAIKGNPKEKILGLKTIVDKYGNTEYGNTAKIYLANAYFMLAKIDEAERYFDDYSGSNNLLKAASLAGIASCYEAKNEFEKAAKYYKKAAGISKENPQNGYYLIRCADNLSKSNQKSEALELLKTIKNDYKTDRNVMMEVDNLIQILED